MAFFCMVHMQLMIFLTETSNLLEDCLRYLVLGAIQGLTEFLPISSTAHLKVVPIALGWGDPGVSVTAVLQLGSIFAVIAYFRRDIQGVLKGIGLGIRQSQWREPQAQLGLALFVGTLPIIFGGMAVKLFWTGYETSFLRGIPAIASVSILMALLLALAERFGPRLKTLRMVKGRDGLVVGLGQVLALIPGVSRSGITLTASLLDGWERKEAARFSFLLGIPAITLAGLVELKDAFEVSSTHGFLPIVLGIASATVVSWLSIDWLLSYLERHSAWIFVAYRLFFGMVLLVWWRSVLSN